MIETNPGAAFEADAEGFATGLTGTIGVRIRDTNEADVVARTTSGIVQGTDPDFPTVIVYSATLTAPTAGGLYQVVFDDSYGNISEEDLFVGGSAVSGNLYLTAASLKATLTLTSQTFADADIDAAISAASRGIDKVCRRRFYADADANQVRYFLPISKALVRIEDLVTLTSLQTDPGGDGVYELTWTLNTDFTLNPVNAAADGRPWDLVKVHPNGNYAFSPDKPRSVKVTGKFGWSAVPPEIVEATTILAAKLLKRAREAPFGIVTVGLDSGAAMRVARNDPDVLFLLDSFIKGSGPSGGGFA